MKDSIGSACCSIRLYVYGHDYGVTFIRYTQSQTFWTDK